jgi:phosphoribosylaminoimidazole-succinocarboxamide synthase
MNKTSLLYESNLRSLPLLARGKVRDIYAVDDQRLLIVATDRLSAFDVILPDPIPDKGVVLTEVSNFWFEYTRDLIDNHLLPGKLDEVVKDPDDLAQIRRRAVLVRRVKPLPVEAIVRGYLIGSGWKDYQAVGAVSGIALPPGLKQAARLPAPIFTPSTKAEIGEHDENIGYEQTEGLLGAELASQVRATSLAIYQRAAAYAAERGIIIADTKFEFGVDNDGKLLLIDEALTPDSSRFWPQEGYREGISPPSFDKQFVRDYLEGLNWNKRPPAPELPPDIITRTAEKYREARDRLIK